MKNAFQAGRPVVGHSLVGRDELLDELENILAIDQSVVLVAPRRYGKTSVALEVLKRFKKRGYFVADVDVFDVTDKRRLADKIIESCLQNNPVPVARYWKKLKAGALSVLSMLKFKPSDDDIEMVLQLSKPSVDEDKILDDALDFPEKFCRRHDKKMILFMDEFQDILKMGGEALLKKMRAKFQRHKNVIYVFAGSQESLMKTLFQLKQHAFYKFARIFEVGTISQEAFAPYITRSFAEGKIKITDDGVSAILKISGGHPYYTQLLCQMIYINCLKTKSTVISLPDISTAAHEVVAHEEAFFDETWKELGNKKHSRGIAGLIAQGKSPYSYEGSTKENISRILSDLVHYGTIGKTGTGKSTQYFHKDPFFTQYVQLKFKD